MKRNNLRTMAVAAIAILAGYNVYLAQPKTNDEISDLLAANVEALSQSEELPGGQITCSQYCNDGIGKCWTKSEPGRCVLSGSPHDSCHTKMDGNRTCVKLDGTEYN